MMPDFISLRRLCLVLALAWLPSASAATLALLVGVNQYPSLSSERQLRGPANDVSALRALLQRQGAAVQVLSDAAPQSQGTPTHAAILSGLEQLLAASARGDWLFVYFAGHGSQQPAPPGSDEADGLDELFLPQDVGRWDGRQGRVQNALIDDEIGRWLQKASQAERRVWLVVDSCHAGDMAKSWSPPNMPPENGRRMRHVPAEELGVPAQMLAGRRQTASRPGAHAKSMAQTPAARLSWPGVVAFYAAQANEPTPEENLPLDGRMLVRGLFTASLLQALADPQVNTFRQLLDGVQARYRDRPFPTPWGEGALDQPLPWRSTARQA